MLFAAPPIEIRGNQQSSHIALSILLCRPLAETFGVPFAQLAGCSGQVRALPVVQGVAMAEPHEDDEEEEDDERMVRETRTTEPRSTPRAH